MAKSEIYNNESLHKAERKEMIRECRKDKMKIMAEKILIITGGTVDYEWAKDWLSAKTYDYCIAADSGLVHADKLGIRVDYILGDYDSVNERLLDTYKKDTQTVTYPPEKNYTDTHLAVITALKHHPAAIDILGATGTRYDHALTNIFIMKQALEAGKECCIYDKYNKIYLLNGNKTIKKADQYGKYISFVPMTEEVVLTLKGLKYPLNGYILRQGLSICQSNEIKEETAEILIEKGIVAAIESRD